MSGSPIRARRVLSVLTILALLLTFPQVAEAAGRPTTTNTNAVVITIDETSDGTGVTVDGALTDPDDRFLRRVASWQLTVEASTVEGTQTVFDGAVDGPEFTVQYPHHDRVAGGYTAVLEGRSYSGRVLYRSEADWCCETAVLPGSAEVPVPTFVYHDTKTMVLSASGSVGDADGSATYEVGFGFVLCLRNDYPFLSGCYTNRIMDLITFTNEQVEAGEGFYDLLIGEEEAWIVVTKRDADGQILSRVEHRTPCDDYPNNHTCDTFITTPSVSEWTVTDGHITGIRGTTGGPDDASRIWGIVVGSTIAFAADMTPGEFHIQFDNPLPVGEMNWMTIEKRSGSGMELGKWTFAAPQPPAP